MFEKWHNVSYRYVSYVKAETSDIWRTGAQFLKPSGERFEKNRIYDLLNTNSRVKTRKYVEGITYVTKFFPKKEKLTLRAKFET